LKDNSKNSSEEEASKEGSSEREGRLLAKPPSIRGCGRAMRLEHDNEINLVWPNCVSATVESLPVEKDYTGRSV